MGNTIWISALTLGFLGSFHCAGMCGPIAMMLPASSASKSKILLGRFLYNTGRIFTYVVLGSIFGMIGFSVAISGFQKELSVITGVIILLTLVITSGKKQKIATYSTALGFTGMIRTKLKGLFRNGSMLSLFFIGVLNGLLPCGFVYLASAGAIATGSMAGGMIYMTLFGLGTFPMMMFIAVAANLLSLEFKRVFVKITPVIAIALALLLIQRGSESFTNNTHSHDSKAVFCKP